MFAHCTKLKLKDVFCSSNIIPILGSDPRNILQLGNYNRNGSGTNRINDGPESSGEGRNLFPDLGVHPKLGNQMHVAEIGLS